MKSGFTRKLSAALLAGSLLAGTAAFANPHDYGHGRDARAYEHRGFEGRGFEGRGFEGHRFEDRGRYVAPRYERRWVEPRFWHRGEFLPVGYRGRGGWVPNWAFYRLRPPPPGCAWVQVGDDFVLTAIATGLVVDVVHHLIG